MTTRRDFIAILPAVPATLALPASTASAMGREELIRYHGEKLLELLSETVPGEPALLNVETSRGTLTPGRGGNPGLWVGATASYHCPVNVVARMDCAPTHGIGWHEV